MVVSSAVVILSLPIASRADDAPAESTSRPARPADELFWTPTLDQAIDMATANRVPIFVMGYSMVGDRSTYSKLGDDCASAVF